jgi:hypothetical protein
VWKIDVPLMTVIPANEGIAEISCWGTLIVFIDLENCREQQGTNVTRSISQYLAQGARPRVDVSGQWHQAARPYRIV